MTGIAVRLIALLIAGSLGVAQTQSSGDAPPLTETLEFAAKFGFGIDHPAGWLVDILPGPGITFLSELEIDRAALLRGLVPSEFPAEGISITHQHVDLSYLRGLGLPADPDLDTLLRFNAEFFSWQEPLEPVETEIFGVPALEVRTVDLSGDAVIALQGFIGGRVFIFMVSAPSEKALDAFLPTWQAMLASIERTATE